MQPNYAKWADEQVQMYSERFEARLRVYLERGGDRTPAALLAFANTSSISTLVKEARAS